MKSQAISNWKRTHHPRIRVSVFIIILLSLSLVFLTSCTEILKALGAGVADVTTESDFALLDNFVDTAFLCKFCETEPLQTATTSDISIFDTPKTINKTEFDGYIRVKYEEKEYQCKKLGPGSAPGGKSTSSCPPGWTYDVTKTKTYYLCVGIYIKNDKFALTFEWNTAPPLKVQNHYYDLFNKWLKDSVANMDKQAQYGFEATEVKIGQSLVSGEYQVGLLGRKKSGP